MWPFTRNVEKPTDPVHEGIAAGGARFERLIYTRNRRVMASSAEGGRTLRLHESFRDATPEVLRAIGELFSTRSRVRRSVAREVVRTYFATRVAPTAVAVRRPARPRPQDLPYLHRLLEEFDAVNESHFAGTLPSVPIRLSGRMRRRNGHFSVDPLEIAISRTLCTQGATGEAERTMRHEMIHLWQWREGRKPGHGMDFRHWADRLGIHPRATRIVCWSTDAA